MAESPPAKRKKAKFKSTDIRNNETKPKNYNRFYIIKRTETDEIGNVLDFSRISPFFIYKNLNNLIGEVKQCKKLRDGTLLAQILSDKQSDKILKCENLLNNFPIKVEPHARLNMSRGVIWCPELNFCSIEEIKDELKMQNVVDVKRMTFYKNNEKHESNNYLLTFNIPALPNEIKIGYHNVNVRMFISNPTRCMVCCRFGHTKLKCKKEPICRYCGTAKHEGTQCSSPLKCVNCQEQHDSFSKTCKAFLKEKEIRSIQDMDKISYMAAKKKYESLHPLSSQINFSNIVKNQKKVSVSVQTDELDKVFVFKKSSETNYKPSLIPGRAVDSTKSGTPTPPLH
ncbi:uncharacterized protein, partial [Halyomorpha halys]|uniref:uncharacterized protein n=1 Tax=Halyomorpha halys TaxID=286706 RepID=UPI0006D4E006